MYVYIERYWWESKLKLALVMIGCFILVLLSMAGAFDQFKEENQEENITTTTITTTTTETQNTEK